MIKFLLFFQLFSTLINIIWSHNTLRVNCSEDLLLSFKQTAAKCFFFRLFFHNVVDCTIVHILMMLDLVLMQTKAAYGPVGAASEGKRAAGPWSPLGPRGFLWGYVHAAAAGW